MSAWIAVSVSVTIGAITLQSVPQSFRASANIVSIDASVSSAGRPVGDLLNSEFELFDNGVRQDIVDASREALPIDATLVLDVSESVQGPLLTSLARAADRVRNTLRPMDTIAVVAFNERTYEVLNQRYETLESLIASFRGVLGKTSLYDAIALTLPNPSKPERRSMILVFTDGRDTASFLDEGVLLEEARATSTAAFIVSFSKLADRPLFDPRATVFKELAATTGGKVTDITSDGEIGGQFLAAIDLFRNAYVLRYVPKDVSTTGWHDVTVNIKRRGKYEVHSRRGYAR